MTYNTTLRPPKYSLVHSWMNIKTRKGDRSDKYWTVIGIIHDAQKHDQRKDKLAVRAFVVFTVTLADPLSNPSNEHSPGPPDGLPDDALM